MRDASGYLPDRRRSTRFGLAFLRCDFPLQPGYVITVEPGFGGIRIEDDVLVTAGEPDVLTAAIPKTL